MKLITLNSNLLKELVRRDVRDRYSGSWLGIAWSLITPILLIVIYATVFGAIFGTRIPGMEKHESTFGFGVYLYSGLLVFSIFAEVVTRSPGLIYGNPNYVKKVVFPLELLPIVVLCSAFVNAALPLAVLLAATFVILGSLPPTAILYPFGLLLMVPMLVGLGWAISALGTYVRDLGHAIGLLVTVFMFLSPIFVPVAKFPAWAQPIVRTNPISVPIEICNGFLFNTPLPPLPVVIAYAFTSVVVLFAGWKVFSACRPGFADVL